MTMTTTSALFIKGRIAALLNVLDLVEDISCGCVAECPSIDPDAVWKLLDAAKIELETIRAEDGPKYLIETFKGDNNE